MPVPPEYDKTLKVYFDLRTAADAKGEVQKSIRQLAKDTDRSWSALRWHILHLEESGLLIRHDGASAHKKGIQLRNMALDDPEAVYSVIASVPRSSWQKRGQQPEGVK